MVSGGFFSQRYPLPLEINQIPKGRGHQWHSITDGAVDGTLRQSALQLTRPLFLMRTVGLSIPARAAFNQQGIAPSRCFILIL